MKAAIALLTSILLTSCSYLSNNGPSLVGNALSNNQKVQSLTIDFATVSTLILQPKCLNCHQAHNFLKSAEGIRANAGDIFDSVFVTQDMPRAPIPELTLCEAAILQKFLEEDAPVETQTTIGDLEPCKVAQATPTPTPEPMPSATPEPTPTPEPVDEVTFDEVFANVISLRCIRCHAEDSKRPLTSETVIIERGWIIPGNADASTLVRLVESTGIDRMPPRGEALTPDQISMIKAWINGL